LLTSERALPFGAPYVARAILVGPRILKDKRRSYVRVVLVTGSVVFVRLCPSSAAVLWGLPRLPAHPLRHEHLL
jgi:hypothetical protein